MSFERPSIHMPANPFLKILLESLEQPIEWNDFLLSYQAAIEAVSESGRFMLHGMAIETPAGVYSPHETSSTRFVCDNFLPLGLLNADPGGKALEIGSGAGAISILLAKNGWDVTAVDIDPIAVEATLQNAKTNKVSLTAFESNLFSSVEGKFDVIVFNQPLFHKATEIVLNERTLSSQGSDLYKRFMRQALQHLTENGRVIVTYANFSEPEALMQPNWEMSVKAFDYEAARNTIRAIFEAKRVA